MNYGLIGGEMPAVVLCHENMHIDISEKNSKRYG